MMRDDLIPALHATPHRGVLAITGGGSGALERLLTVGGASGTVLEAVVPYSEPALADWLGYAPERACDESTARAMAMRSLLRAQQLEPDTDPTELFGVGCTASLATTRTKRGEHRAFVSVQTVEQTLVVTLHFEKGRRGRSEEEKAVAHAIVAATADVAGVHELNLTRTPPGIDATVRRLVGPMEWVELRRGERRVVPIENAPAADESVCLIPGSFNPLHRGHREIARLAAERAGWPAVFELSITNVEKPPLDYLEIEHRLEGLRDQAVWLTDAPTFLQKAEIAPGSVFAVGADTIERVGQGRFYASLAERDAAIGRLAELGCRFLVFGRLTGGRFEGLDDLRLDADLRAICDGVSEEDFRIDISSTEIRDS